MEERTALTHQVKAIRRNSDTVIHWRNFALKSGGDQCRRQDLVSGAEGASIEVPKAPYEEFYSREMSRRHCPEVSAYMPASHMQLPRVCLGPPCIRRVRECLPECLGPCVARLCRASRVGAPISTCWYHAICTSTVNCRPASSTGRLHGKLTAVNDHRTNQQTAFERYHGDKHFS